MVQSDGIHGFGTGSVESLASRTVNSDLFLRGMNSDLVALDELKWALRDSKPVHNEYLDMKPEDIPGTSGASTSKEFYSDNLDLLTLDKINTSHGSWKMIDRGQGWAILFERMWHGWKRTLVFKPFQPSKSHKTWYMNVFAIIGEGKFVKPLYRCEIFEVSNSYDPRPECVSLIGPTIYDPIPLQEDPGEIKSLAEELRAIATNPNLLPYVEHQDYKKEKFETIKARCPDGKVIKWSICNHCGMVYKGIPNKAVQDNHKCKCGWPGATLLPTARSSQSSACSSQV